MDSNPIIVQCPLSPYNKKMSGKTVRIFDTTLRDGEQSPGISLSVESKVRIANMLDEAGVDCIEAGFAASSEIDREVLSLLSGKLNADVYSLSRCLKSDIDLVKECGINNIHMFIATSDTHLVHKLNKTRDQVLSMVKESVSYASSLGMNIMFSCEDTTRTQYDYLKQVFSVAVEAGAKCINIADTVGAITPDGMYSLVSMLKRDIPNVEISVHCHNDLGLAVANTLFAIDAGATVAQTCFNGIGERTGNASTEEIALNLKLNHEIETIDLSKIELISRNVSRLTGYSIPLNKPVVGKNAFAHESGIHVHGIMKNSSTYESYPPELVGRNRDISIGRHSGSHSILEKLSSMGMRFPEEYTDKLLNAVKNLSLNRGLSDIELVAIAENILWKGKSVERVKLKEFVVVTGKNVTPTATVTIEIDGESSLAAKTGNGPVDAAFNAICSAIDNKITFEELRLESITGGSDSLCEVTVLVRGVNDDSRLSAGKALGMDIVDTTVDAFMQAINRGFERGGI